MRPPAPAEEGGEIVDPCSYGIFSTDLLVNYIFSVLV